MQDLIHDGNSVILVDHDTQILSEADWLIEMGPQAGAGGGQVIAQGSIPAIEANAASRIGSGLAAVAALMYCSTYPRVTTDMGSMMGMKAFIAAVLGGIGIIPGAMIGGILVGLIEIFVKLFAPGWYEAVTYGTLIVILLVKPAGILGKNTGEKV